MLQATDGRAMRSLACWQSEQIWNVVDGAPVEGLDYVVILCEGSRDVPVGILVLCLGIQPRTLDLQRSGSLTVMALPELLES